MRPRRRRRPAAEWTNSARRSSRSTIGWRKCAISRRRGQWRPESASAAPKAAAAPAKPIRIEPGEKVSVVVKNKCFYTGSYIGMTDKTVKLQTIPDPTARPSEWDIREVQAFQTRDGIFAYNESTGQFEPGVSYYRFNKSTGQMDKINSAQDTYLAQDAQILGPTNSAQALLSIGPTGEWTVGLPMPESRSPQSIPAYHFKEIVTSKGVYAYDDQKQDFVYKSHTEFARGQGSERQVLGRMAEEELGSPSSGISTWH